MKREGVASHEEIGMKGEIKEILSWFDILSSCLCEDGGTELIVKMSLGE